MCRGKEVFVFEAAPRLQGSLRHVIEGGTMKSVLPATRQHVLRSAAVAVVALAALATGSASLAGTGTSINIAPTAYYADGPIDVTVTIQCGSAFKPEGLGSVLVMV